MTAKQDDPELRGPARLSAPNVRVVRLNRRVLYVIGATLVVVVLAGLVARRAQRARLAQDANSHTSRLPIAASERWFDKVPDREPLDQPASTAPAPALALKPASTSSGQDPYRRRARGPATGARAPSGHGGTDRTGPTAGNVLGAALGQELGQTDKESPHVRRKRASLRTKS